jgi:hypothetical protein
MQSKSLQDQLSTVRASTADDHKVLKEAAEHNARALRTFSTSKTEQHKEEIKALEVRSRWHAVVAVCSMSGSDVLHC